jgi:hypothetical protein
MDLSWACGSGPFLGGVTLTSKEPEQSRAAQERHTRAGGLTAFMSTTSTSSDIRPAAAAAPAQPVSAVSSWIDAPLAYRSTGPASAVRTCSGVV